MPIGKLLSLRMPLKYMVNIRSMETDIVSLDDRLPKVFLVHVIATAVTTRLPTGLRTLIW